MEKEQSVYTEKIRNAIKKKLIEMSVFIDDELPEYILVLVANKRSKSHIEKDLSLFLGKHTVDFTNWLYELIRSFKSESKTFSKTDEKSEAKIDSDLDSDILALDPQEQEDLFCPDEQNKESSISAAIQPKPLAILPATKQASVEKVNNAPKVTVTNDTCSNTNPSDKPKEYPPKAAKVYPIQQFIRKLPDVKPLRKCNIAKLDEDDPSHSYVNSVPSAVHVTGRKHNLSAAFQSNKLLLRAINDATKSVLGGKDIKELYDSAPINVLDNDVENKEENFDKFNVKYLSQLLAKHEDPSYSEINPICDTYTCEINPQVQKILYDTNIPTPAVNETHTQSEDVSDNDSGLNEKKLNASPQFIVTLQGLDLKVFKRKRELYDPDLDEEEDMEVDESEEHLPTISPEKKKRLNEKCRYWPACKSGDKCLYHHPTISCKLFPNCNYGDKCLYIHPNCKFDALCSKKDCPYTHASKRKLPSHLHMPVISVKKLKKQQVCKFYPKCQSKMCPFIHPKSCWYGNDCQSRKCTYSHIPSRKQLKWQAGGT